MSLIFLTKKLLPLQQHFNRQAHELKAIFFELTHKCNVKCLHCGSDCVKDAVTPDLPASSVINVLKDIKTKMDSHKITVILSGGEPLCYPGLFELCTEINKLEFPFGMVTNGYGWTTEKLKKIEQAGLATITVSLDGLESDHDWLRGQTGSFEAAVRTIKYLVKNPFYQAMDIVTCVNKKNLKNLDAIRELLISLGVKEWRLFTISPIGRAVNVPELFLDSSEFKLMLDKIIEYRKNDVLKTTYSESGYLGPCYELDQKVRSHYFFCQAGISVAGIMANGDILACPNIDRRFSQGNINKDSFMDVWENKYKEFRNRNWMKQGDCKTCKEWPLCKGNSFHLWDLDKNKTKLCYLKTHKL